MLCNTTFVVANRSGWAFNVQYVDGAELCDVILDSTIADVRDCLLATDRIQAHLAWSATVR